MTTSSTHAAIITPSASAAPFLLLLTLSLIASATSAGSLPFAYFHGHGSSCEAESIFWKYFINATNTQGVCIEIGNGAEDSKNLTMWKQAEIGCRNVSSNPLFANGLNLVGISQGGLLARTILQTCDTLPPVNNLISVGSPQMGIASYPHCAPQLLPLPCRARSAAAHRVYREAGYDNSSAAGYFKVPTALPAYYKNNNFLKYINNELASTRNETYKERVKKLNTLVLIKFRNDHVVFPRESEHFRFFAPGSFRVIPPLKATAFYQEDHLGIRYLMENGRVKFFTVPGGHIFLTKQAANRTVIPFLS